MRWFAGLLLAGLHCFPLASWGEEPAEKTSVADSSGLQPEDLPVIEMLELLQVYELLQDMTLLQENGDDAVVEEKP